MKVKRGVNPDFADHDELDPDVEDAISEFERGNISLSELKAMIGPEDAEMYADKIWGGTEEFNIDDLFDDPSEL